MNSVEDNEVAMEVHQISKSYGAVQALRNVDLTIRRGEVLALVGDNGAGKTTLVKCLSGVLRPDSGEIYIGGEAHEHLTPEQARELGIETVYQNLSLVDTMTVTQNFFLNREILHANPVARLLHWTDRRQMEHETTKHLKELEINAEARRPVSALSGGQRQMVAFARAMSWGRHILILDEPAAALGVGKAAFVLKFIRSMTSRGVAVLFISHNMQHVFQVADRIVVLRHGEKVGEKQTVDTHARDIVTLITGSELVVQGEGGFV